MARRYDMRARSRAAAATRTRIIEAAHRLLGRPDGGVLALHEVAAEAGVSRATIYQSVGVRRQLLAAVLEDQGRLIGYHQVLAAMQLPDAGEALVATVKESCRAYGVLPEAIRRTLALAVIDSEIGELVATYERYRRGEMGRLARRAHRAGKLKAGVSGPEAGATLALLSGFPAFDQLRLAYGAARATGHLVRLTKTLLAED